MLEKINEKKYIEFALSAYNIINQWFGEPKDKHWKYELFWSDRNGCMRTKILRQYLIGIKEYESDEQIFETIAHEIYHRCTILTRQAIFNKGLHRYVWVDELLAMLTAIQVISLYGMEEYASHFIKSQIYPECRMEMGRLKYVKRRSIRNPWKKNAYPVGMSSTVAFIAQELNAECEWHEIINMSKCTTWQQWFASLPCDKRQRTQKILECII